MAEFSVNWKPTQREYSNGESCYLGKWVVARVFYDGMSPKDESKKYRIEMLLPGYKAFIGLRFLTTDEAKLQTVRFISNWLDKAGLSESKEE
jgi:hypothetical protein